MSTRRQIIDDRLYAHYRVPPMIFRSRLCHSRGLSRKIVGVAQQQDDRVAAGRLVTLSPWAFSENVERSGLPAPEKDQGYPLPVIDLVNNLG